MRLNRCGLLLASVLSTSCALLPESGSISNSEKARLNLEMGSRYLELGMLEAAKTKLDTALSLDANNPEIENSLGVFYERINDLNQAGDYYQKAAKLAPDNASIQSNYGHFLCQRGDYAEGISLLQKTQASALNKQPWVAATNLGICYQQQNDLNSAEQHFRQALQNQADYPPALLAMQKISYQHRQYLSARGFMERYLSVAKHTAESLWLATQTERALGNNHLAADYSQQLLSSFPSSQQAQQIKSAISN